MIGILCEKPSAMRNFAKALGGISGNYNNEDYVLCCARGHLFQLIDPKNQVAKEKQNKYKNWNLSNLPWEETDFKWKFQQIEGTTQTLAQIKQTLSKCDEICIGTDDDPSGEGELIAWEIIKSLKLGRKKITRMYFTDESESQIQKAFINRKSIPSINKDMDFTKAFYRARWDFLSMQFTRIATKINNKGLLLRNGRLKSAMVVFIGDQFKAIKNYKKIPFYENRFKDENGIIYKNKEEQQYKNKNDVPNIYNPSKVLLEKIEQKKKNPPKLIDLSTLSGMLASKGYSADEVLDTYQRMYEDQIVSYPRTEDKTITEEQFNDLLPLVDKIADSVGVNKILLKIKTPRKTHVKNTGTHGANRPGINVPNDKNNLSSYGRCAPLLYEIIARNYLAMFCEDYSYEVHKGYLQDYPNFKGQAIIPINLGWKQIYNDDKDKVDLDGLGTLASPFVYEGFPPKPKNPTMKWLMKELEKKDIGTGATRTSTYAEISKNDKSSLIKDNKGRITFTECGETNYILLKDTYIGSLDITKKLLNEMKLIGEGKLNPEERLSIVKQLVMADKDIMIKNAKENNLYQEEQYTKEYPQKDKYTGMWLKPGTKNKREVSFNKTWGGHTFTEKECEALLNGEEISFEAISSNNKKYTATGKLVEQTYKKKKFVGFKADFNKQKKPQKKRVFTQTSEEFINGLMQ